MKTVAQLAEKMKISKQAIHKKIKQEPLKSSLQGFTRTIKSTLYFEIDGEKLVKSAFAEYLKRRNKQAKKIKADEQIANLQREINKLQADNNELRRKCDELRKIAENIKSEYDKMGDFLEANKHKLL